MNHIPNGDFSAGPIGAVPPYWTLKTPRPCKAPVFRVVKSNGRRFLLAGGNGSDDCFGYVHAPVRLRPGRTYRLRARFRIAGGINPHRHLRFGVFTRDFNDGIFHFHRKPGGWIEGEGCFLVPRRCDARAEVRVFFGMSARGKAWIREIMLEETDPVSSRPVRVACVQGEAGLRQWARVLDVAARNRADMVLLPEMMHGHVVESADGPSGRFLSRKSRQHCMYVAGGIYRWGAKRRRVYNTVLLFDRRGRLAGQYDKNHPYTPELWTEGGVTPGHDVPVFQTDVGTVGIMTCYDSWFTDVVELLALKGAEIVLFPNAGYCASLMPARAADNGVRIVNSSVMCPAGIWDTAGRDVTRPRRDPTLWANCPPSTTACDIQRRKIGKIKMLLATLDLSQSPSPHNWGGPMLSAPGGRRNRREQTHFLYDEIRAEAERWWDTD